MVNLKKALLVMMAALLLVCTGQLALAVDFQAETATLSGGAVVEGNYVKLTQGGGKITFNGLPSGATKVVVHYRTTANANANFNFNGQWNANVNNSLTDTTVNDPKGSYSKTTYYISLNTIYNGQAVWIDKISVNTSGTGDTVAPTVVLTAPASNATVSGSVTISAVASDNVGVSRVEFYYGTTLIATDDTAPYSVTWDTTTVANGTYNLTAKAYDTSGNVQTSAARRVTVNNQSGGDTIAPTVALTAPAAGATVSGNVTVSATASDNVGVSRVEFYYGTTLIATDDTAPYSVTWDTTTVANGSYSLTAKAYDAAGNVGTSAARSVTVNNATATGLKVHFKNNSFTNWSTFNCYFWNSNGSPQENTWPGQSMTAEGNNWYLFVVPGASSANVIFNNGSAQTVDLSRTGEGWWVPTGISDGKIVGVWYDTNPDGDVGDTVAPTVALTAPAAGATVSGNVTVSATASDNVGVSRVEFYYGTNLIATDDTAPYSVTWNTTAVANGSYSLTAKAYDVAGNVGTSAAVSVTVNNEGAVQGLTVHFKRPDHWAETVRIHYWNTVPSTVPISGPWPGPLMQYDGDGWYSYTVAGATAMNIVFNDGQGRQTADLHRANAEGWYYTDNQWYDYNPEAPAPPVISVSVDGSHPYKGSTVIQVRVTPRNAEVTSKSAAFNGNTLTFNGDLAQFTLADYLNNKESGTLSVTASSSAGTSTKTVVIERDDDYMPPTGTFTWDNALVYFVITDRFYNGNPDNDESYGRRKDYGSPLLNTGTFHGGDLAGLTQKLQSGYFTDLGVNAIWISAVYEQIHGWCGGGDGDFPHYPYHGYYALDWTMMDQNMGTIEEMRTFVDTAHSLGIRVVMDVVLNHTGYNTILDMNTYNFGEYDKMRLVNDWTPGPGQNWHSHHEYINYENCQNPGLWQNWWGTGWVRTGVQGYTQGDGSELQNPLSGLPDLRTELTTSQGLPNILMNKWAMETSGYSQWINPSAVELRKDLGLAPADYVIKWLAAWVREFGIDGFRCDTAKHVELSRWAQLKEECQRALEEWRAANPGKPGADWTEPFWMVGEHWDHGVGRSAYFDNGFDSMINFTFPNKDGNTQTVGATWQAYADAINSDPTWNVLTYISSHDTTLYAIGNKIHAGTCLLLCPGGVQIFYGDENDRPLGPPCSDPQQRTRSDYVWGANPEVLAHWQKLGRFRNMHPAVGAGSQISLGNDTYGRIWNNDKVVIKINASGETEVTVAGVFAEGTRVRNAYNGETGIVTNGKVTFTAENGVILIEEY